MSQQESINVHLEYLENLNLLNVSILYAQECKDISFERNSLRVIAKTSCEYKVNFDNFTIDPSTGSNVSIKKYSNKGNFEANFRFKVVDFKEQVQSDAVQKSLALESIKSIKCLLCSTDFAQQNGEFKLLPMPEHDLDELEDNFWCHKHNHCHGDSHEHDHDQPEPSVVDKYKHKKSILFNNSTLVVNSNHISYDLINLSDNNTNINCSNCTYNIGYKNKRDNYHLWQSNILINNTQHFDLFQQIKLGRYIIEIQSRKKKQRDFLFLHILTTDLYYQHVTSVTTGSNTQLCFNKRSKKLLYKCYDTEKDAQLRLQWFNDINVEFMSISYDYYLIALKRLVTSTQSLPNSYKMTKNGFFIAIV